MKYVFIENEENLPKSLKYYCPIRCIDSVPSPYKNSISIKQYLAFAKEDVKDKNIKNRVNALSNIKRAIHLNVDLILNQCSLFEYSKKFNFPSKMELLKKIEAVPSSILNKINIERNLLEHQYKAPTFEITKEALDIAELFIMATERYFIRFCVEMRVGFSRDKRDILLRLNAMDSIIEKYDIIGSKSEIINKIKVFKDHIFMFGEERKLAPGLKLKLISKTKINKKNIDEVLPFIRLFVYETRNSEGVKQENTFTITTYLPDGDKLREYLDEFINKGILKRKKK